MSGICGVLFDDRSQSVEHAHMAPMVGALAFSRGGEVCAARRGAVGLGALEFPGRLTGIAQMPTQDSWVALAFHGSLFPSQPPQGPGANPLMELLDRYLREGMALLERLRGEFALAIWDGPAATLHLATDRFRVHPLFYYHDGRKFLFASRLKSILACPLSIDRTINLEAIVDVVGSSFVPTPKTILRAVKKLPPGHVLTYRGNTTRLSPYWQLSFLDPDPAPEAELARKLRASLEEAAAIRLDRETAPGSIGAFLSGGVDSSTLTGLLTRRLGQPIKTFSIGFQEEPFNETGYARTAARAFGTRHHERILSSRDVLDAIPTLLDAFDEPYANASAIPTHACARLARENGVDVMYAGDGGDELFAGNERYATQRLLDYYDRIPPGLRQRALMPVVFAVADILPLNPFVKAKKYIQRASIPYPDRLTSYGFFRVVPLAELFDDVLLDGVGRDYDPDAALRLHYLQALARTDLDRQLYIDLQLAVADNDLFKVTRMTEAAGLVVRFPFLDHRLAQFAARIPARIKMRGRRLRSFFKDAYADLLPPAIRAKKKHGFGLPISHWLRTDTRLNDLMHDLLLSPSATQRGYFRPRAVQHLLDRHRTDHTSFYGTVVWNLMTLELWHRSVTGEPAPLSATAPIPSSGRA